MKKSLLIVLCVILLIGLTGCGNDLKENSNSTNNNSSQNDNIKDSGEELIYQFNDYIQKKDTKSMAKLFNEKYMAIKDTTYYNHDELANYFEKVFNDSSYSSYKISKVYKINDSNDFNKYYKENGLNYDELMKTMNDLYDYKVFMYIADVNYNGEEVQDIIYLGEKNDSYIIERSTYWSFFIAAYRN